VDEKAITRHDFVETNGHNFMLSLLPAVVGLVVVRPASATLVDVFVGMALLALVVFNACTSQIHKWAHQDKPARFVQLLQRAHLIISPEHHSLHHAAPHTRNYCITLGWMNGPLRAVRFFETLERIITAITGAVPRADDLGEKEALEVAAALERDAEVDSAAPAPVVMRD
jgi:ubiquitin-conjugating enzyme E2 variant